MNDKSNILLKLRDVTKIYPTGSGIFSALEKVSFDVVAGELLGITGKSGAGKTTLLNMISGINTITSGEVLFFDPYAQAGNAADKPVSVHEMDEDAKANWRGGNVGIVYQSFELMPTLNLLENVMLPQDFSKEYRPVASTARALELLELVEISEHAYKKPAHISGGQKQRVAIARALMNDPALILADEPTGNLDTVTAETIFNLFEKLVDQGKTIVMVTHDNSLVGRFSRRLMIADGKLVGDKSKAPFPKNPANPTLAKPIEIISTSNPFGSINCSPRKTQNAIVGSRFQPVEEKAIVLQEITKTYLNAAGDFPALKGVDLTFDYGQFISIVGKSGCGKSTLLNMITGIDYPTSGKVMVGGQEIYKMSESQRALWRGRNVGIVFQFFQLLPTLTILENTMLPMDYCGIYDFRDRPDQAMALLERIGLGEVAHMLPANLSSGQQQSAAIARALATDPAILLADEPTGNLDSRSAAAILDLFDELTSLGKTVLIVTHDPSITAITDQTVILSDGEVIDQTVANALPFLDHNQMLQISKKTVKQHFHPGSMILHQGKPVDYFYMVISGEVEVFVNTKVPETTVARLGPGQFFGEIELIHNAVSLAGVRSGNRDSTEIALISKEAFLDLLIGSKRMAKAIQDVAQVRREETFGILERFR